MKKIKKSALLLAIPILLVGCSSVEHKNNKSGSSESVNQTEETTTKSTLEQTQPITSNKEKSTANVVENNDKSVVSAEQINDKIAKSVKIFQNTYPNYDIKSIDINSISATNITSEVEGINDINEIKVVIDSTEKLRVIKEEMLDPEDRGGVERNKESIDTINLAPFSKVYDIAKQQLNLVNITRVKIDKDNNIIKWDVELDNRDITIANDNLRVIK